MTENYRTFNTTVSGSALISSLSGDDIRALEFDASLSQPPTRALTGASTLYAEDWVQASLGGLILSADATGDYIDLGLDTADNALRYINLFKMSTGSQRAFRFILGGTGGSTINLQNTTGGTNAAYVRINVANTGAASGTGSCPLFDSGQTGAAGFCPGENPGYTRIVLLKPVDLTSGAEKVQFTILPRSM